MLTLWRIEKYLVWKKSFEYPWSERSSKCTVCISTWNHRLCQFQMWELDLQKVTVLKKLLCFKIKIKIHCLGGVKKGLHERILPLHRPVGLSTNGFWLQLAHVIVDFLLERTKLQSYKMRPALIRFVLLYTVFLKILLHFICILIFAKICYVIISLLFLAFLCLHFGFQSPFYI